MEHLKKQACLVVVGIGMAVVVTLAWGCGKPQHGEEGHVHSEDEAHMAEEHTEDEAHMTSDTTAATVPIRAD